MRKLIVQEMVTIDGFFAGPNGEIDWHNVDDEYGEYAKNFLNSLDVLLFGRITYQLMASYWPTATGDVAHKMNTLQKFVCSKSLSEVDWQNTTLIKENVIEEITNLKQQPGRNVAVLGSGVLVSLLTIAGLVDEVQLTIVPIVLGNGKQMFKNIHNRVNMTLLESRTLRSGNIQLLYKPL